MQLTDLLNDALKNRYAIGHFNISDSTQFNAIVSAAEKLDLPVIIGVSEGEKEFLGAENALALVSAARKKGLKVFLNADHHKSVESCKRAIDLGFDSVVFDGVKLPIEENIEKTYELVQYARAVGEREGRQVIVEGELGYIGESSKLLDKVPEDVLEASLPSVEDAVNFVEQTGVDALAPALGNLHGMLKNMPNPRLNIELIENMRKALPDRYIVLHGGSGILDEDFKKAIYAGVNCVHINTEIRKVYREGIEEGLKNKEQIAPYKYMKKARLNVEGIVLQRLKLFANLI